MKNVILVEVDDRNYQMACEAIPDVYSVTRINCAEDLFFQLESLRPDLVFLDINLPGVCGYDACQEIKASSCWQKVVVILVSEQESHDDRAKAAAAGADGFTAKPFIAAEVAHLLEVHLEPKVDAQALREANASIASLIGNNASMGSVLHLVRRACGQQSHAALAAMLLGFCSDNGLSALVQYRSGGDPLMFSEDGISIAPRDLDIIGEGAATGAVFDVGATTVFTHDSLSLLIQQMPIDDELLYGQIKDNYALLVDCFSSRFDSVALQLASANLQTELVTSVDHARSSLMEVQMLRYRQLISMATSVEDLLDNLKNMFSNMVLTEHQEEQLEELVNKALDKVLEVQSEGLQTDVEMERALAELQAVASAELPAMGQDDSSSESEPVDQDIELF